MRVSYDSLGQILEMYINEKAYDSLKQVTAWKGER